MAAPLARAGRAAGSRDAPRRAAAGLARVGQRPQLRPSPACAVRRVRRGMEGRYGVKLCTCRDPLHPTGRSEPRRAENPRQKAKNTRDNRILNMPHAHPNTPPAQCA